MFDLFHRIGTHGNQMDRLVRDVAERSAATSRERLGANTAAMSVAELRGYVRARALRPIRLHAEQIIAERRLRSAVVEEVVALALERTVHRLVCEMLVQPIVATPVGHVPMRAAG